MRLPKPLARWIWPLVALAWFGAVSAGFTLIWRHTYASGPAGQPDHTWPSGLARDRSRPTLVMVLHPECSCSNASLGELARIMARASRPFDIRIFFTPLIGDLDPRNHALWKTASALPGVTVAVDRGAVVAKRFGALVSGQTLLFDSDGTLLFSGGITAARAHAGDNDGASAILQALRDGRAPVPATPVFGCLLFERTAT